MAQISIFYQDLSNEKKKEILNQLNIDLKPEINEAIELNPKMISSDVKTEVISNHINTNNSDNYFKI